MGRVMIASMMNNHRHPAKPCTLCKSVYAAAWRKPENIDPIEPEIQNITDRLPSSRGVYQDPTNHELDSADRGLTDHMRSWIETGSTVNYFRSWILTQTGRPGSVVRTATGNSSPRRIRESRYPSQTRAVVNPRQHVTLTPHKTYRGGTRVRSRFTGICPMT